MRCGVILKSNRVLISLRLHPKSEFSYKTSPYLEQAAYKQTSQQEMSSRAPFAIPCLIVTSCNHDFFFIVNVSKAKKHLLSKSREAEGHFRSLFHGPQILTDNKFSPNFFKTGRHVAFLI